MTKLQTLIARLFNIEVAEPPKLAPPRDLTEFRLADWRKSDNLVIAAKALARDKTWKLQMDVLQTENPCHTVLALGLNPNDRIVQQARTEGYELCLNNLAAFSKPLKFPERLESTFEKPAEQSRTK